MSFSADNRSAWIRDIPKGTFDLIIIGGGITGAGILLDAVTRGLRAVLIEKHDFAFGTSSRSTKLIHGGLRYLKQMEFALVREVGLERAVVHGLAPHLVIPEKMLLPLAENKSMGYWMTSIGLWTYDWLARVRGNDQRRMLSRNETLQAEPLLDPKGITGGALYSEYRTDDARLTTEIIKTAVHYGGIAVNYAQVVSLHYEGGKVSGVEVEDRTNNNRLTVRGKVVVNATGPWVDTVRELDGSRNGKRLHLTKGIHIVVNRSRLPVKQAIYFEAPDGRMIFAIPRADKTYIGTTDTDYSGSIDDVRAEHKEVDYLLRAASSMFPSVELTPQDVESTWAGLRPLIHEDGKSAGELSRKDEIFEAPSGLLSIAGGKLTGYRKMAERVVDRVVQQGDFSAGPCVTQKVPVKTGFGSFREFLAFRDKLMSRFSDLMLRKAVARLCDTYGQAAESIIERASIPGDSTDTQAMLRAELNYCIEDECCIRLSDFAVRRSGMVYFDATGVIREVDRLAAWMGERMGWTSRRTMEEVAEVISLRWL